MFQNYFKIALRNIIGNALYSAINILGLGIGLACCLLILLYLRFELSYESGFADAGRIYRISREYFPSEGVRLRKPASNNAPVAPALLADYPGLVEQAGRIFGGGVQLATEELRDTEPALRFADQGILDIFDFEWLAGEAGSALAEPNSVVLTETLARKYFGTAEVLGRRLRANDVYDLEVTGVIRDLPAATHLSLSGLISLSNLVAVTGPGFLASWGLNDFHTYVLLRPGADIGSLVEDMPAFLARHVGEEAAETSTMRAMNIRDIHLRSDRDGEWHPHGSSTRIYGLAAIAFLILMIACMNFMSIATARSSLRAREVGMRKTLGGTQRQLVAQFFGEALLFTGLAIVLALALAELLLPAFSTLAGVQLRFSDFAKLDFLGIVGALLAGVTALAGAYPAFYLAAFKPARVLNGEVNRGRQGLLFRNVLVAAQFAIAIVLLVATAIVYLQLEYAKGIELGFDKDQIVVVSAGAPDGYQQDWPLFKQELLQSPAIENASASLFLPFGYNDSQAVIQWDGSTANTRIPYMLVDFDFFDTYDIDILAGRDFNEALRTDVGVLADDNPDAPLSVILNEAAVRVLGLKPQASIGGSLTVDGVIDSTVVGVARDTLFESIRRKARPLLFVLMPPDQEQNYQRFGDPVIEVRTGALPQALAHVDATWAKLYPDRPLDRRFLDEDFQALYQAEEKQEALLSIFAVLALLITCFGLFGLATFNAERRTKEIGVRKVMGGSVWSIVLLLTNDFSKLVLIANVVAWPVAYFAMNRWLENFAYRIDLTPLIFIGSGLVALCIAWVTVGGTAARAASAKPVLALRYE